MLMLKKGMRLFTIMIAFFSNTTVYFVFASEMLL